MSRLVTLDASALVKLFKEESGSDEVRAVYAAQADSSLHVVLSTHSVVEVAAVAYREAGVEAAARWWQTILDTRTQLIQLDRQLMAATLRAAAAYGCSLYDAFAPAVADLTGAELWSADLKAHGAIPGVHRVG